jgi:hypothetical protein
MNIKIQIVTGFVLPSAVEGFLKKNDPSTALGETKSRIEPIALPSAVEGLLIKIHAT